MRSKIENEEELRSEVVADDKNNAPLDEEKFDEMIDDEELGAERRQAERERKFFKYLQGCSLFMVFAITVIVVLLYLFLNS